MGVHSWGFIPLFLGCLALSACGGGSSSGASQGQPGPTAFAGTYQGQMTLRAQGVSDTSPVTITVAQNGLVDIDTPDDDDGACVEDPTPGTPFLIGDRISFEASGSCFIAGVGSCDIFLEGELRFSATDAVGDGAFQIRCAGLQPINGTLGLGATKV